MLARPEKGDATTKITNPVTLPITATGRMIISDSISLTVDESSPSVTLYSGCDQVGSNSPSVSDALLLTFSTGCELLVLTPSSAGCEVEVSISSSAKADCCDRQRNAAMKKQVLNFCILFS